MSDDNDNSDFSESISGFKIIGDWDEIVEHGERISYTLKKIGVGEYQEELDEYNNWRPKAVENDKDISKKTADKASIDEDNNEKNNDPKGEINKAKEKVSESVSDISDKEPKKAYNDTSKSAKHAYNAVRNMSRKTFRKGEEAVYENVMTKLSPYYFDNKLISANISQKSNNKYEFEVNINIDEFKKSVSDDLQDIYDDIKRKNITNELKSSDIDTIDENETEEHIAAELESDETKK